MGKSFTLFSILGLLSTAGFAGLPSARAQSAGASADAADGEYIMLSEFEVREARDDGYAATNALSGTRFNTALMDLPRAVEVVTEEFIRDIGATDLYDALNYSSSIAMTSAPGVEDTSGTQFSVRGYPASATYRNGYRAYGIVDPSSISRVEIIKGPSSVFTGSIEPGGTINIITRKPSVRRAHTLNLRYGSFERFRGNIETTDALNASRTMAYRVALVVEDSGSPRMFIGRRSTRVSTAYTWKISERQEFLLEGTYVKNKANIAAPAVFLSPDVNLARQTGSYVLDIDKDFNLSGPHSFSEVDQYQASANYTFSFSRDWSVRAGLYWRDQDHSRLLVNSSFKVGTRRLTGGDSLTSGFRSYTYVPDGDSQAASPQINVLGRMQYGRHLTHRVIFGGEHYRSEDESYTYSSKGVPSSNRALAGTPGYALNKVNVDNPGPELWERPTQDVSLLNRSTVTDAVETQASANVNNIFTWRDHLTFLQGLRFTDVLQKNRSTGVSLRNDAWSECYGLSWRIIDSVSAFVSYAESFLPVSARDYYGNFLPTPVGAGWDYGLKFDLFDHRISGSVIGYDIIRTNVPTPMGTSDVTGVGYSESIGESKSNGFELTVQARPIKPWKMTFAYSYIDAQVTRDLDAAGVPPIGGSSNRYDRSGRMPHIPRHQGSLWNHYKFSSGPLRGLAIGIGVKRVGARRPHYDYPDIPTMEVPYYTNWDANITYEMRVAKRKTLTLGLYGRNLGGSRYMVNSRGFAEPFSLTGSVRLAF